MDDKKFNPLTLAQRVIRASNAPLYLGMERGDIAHVLEGRRGVLTLERADGVLVEWHPVNQAKMISYNQRNRELAAGNLVRFTEKIISRVSLMAIRTYEKSSALISQINNFPRMNANLLSDLGRLQLWRISL